MNSTILMDRWAPAGEPEITDMEWRLLGVGIKRRELMSRLVRLRRLHGEPTKHCGHCKKYMSLPAGVRKQVEAEAKRKAA